MALLSSELQRPLVHNRPVGQPIRPFRCGFLTNGSLGLSLPKNSTVGAQPVADFIAYLHDAAAQLPSAFCWIATQPSQLILAEGGVR